MYYNLCNFGTKVKQIRKKLSLTQGDVFELTNISENTLCRIELGQVLPKHDTLDLLSVVLRTDLNVLLLEHRIDNYNNLQEIEKRIWNNIEIRDYKKLESEVKYLEEVLETNMSDYYSIRCKQLLLYLEAAILRNVELNHSLSLEKLTTALELSICNFELANYQTNSYKDLELLLLMNIGVTFVELKNEKKGFQVLLFCYNYYNQYITTTRLRVYEKICINLSSLSYNLGLHKDGLEYASSGIEYCHKHRIYNFIGVLYIVRGGCEQILGKETALNTLLTGKHFLELAGQHETLKDVIIQCKDLYGIDL
ncbi:MAG: helix-turn-helix domain-containing protein [Alkaliphilus sp.]